MKISLTIPSVNQAPNPQTQSLRLLRAAPLGPSRYSFQTHCGSPLLRGHRPPLQVHLLGQNLQALPRRSDEQNPKPKDGDVSGAYVYGLGLSCSAASHLLGALGAEISKTSVWRDAQEAGEALREKRSVGKARVLEVDETVFKLKGKESREKRSWSVSWSTERAVRPWALRCYSRAMARL